MRNVFSKTAMACLLTSITTAVGIFSLYFINLKVIQTMGLLAGIGVLFAFILTIILLPVLINMFPPGPSKKNTNSLNNALRGVQSIILILERTNERYPKSILLCFSTVSIFSIFGISLIFGFFWILQEFAAYKANTGVRWAHITTRIETSEKSSPTHE